VLAALFLVLALAPATSSRAQSVSTWPMFGGTPTHAFRSTDPAITTGSAGTMGVKWMANLFSADLGSPVEAYNAALQKNVVYVGNERADVFALDASSGQVLWSTNLGVQDKVRATPAVAADGSIWVGTNFSAALYKLNPATGAIMCSVKSLDSEPIMGSPTVVTPQGGSPTVFWDSIDESTTMNGPLVSTNESNCATQFEFTAYRKLSGAWTTPAYAVSAAGEPLVFYGSADVDSTEYAVDAITGKIVWEFVTYNPADYDIGDASTLSLPGQNGFADGVVYVNNKYALDYALDMTTGKLLWQYDFYPANWNGLRNTISSNAIDGNQLVDGSILGIVSLNATTGAQLWQYATPAEVASSPVIAGPTGSEVVAFGDYTGAVRLLSLASGSPLYTYHTGGYITASPAVANGTIFISSSDGFLYAFQPNGGNGAPPATQITPPANPMAVPNPDGSVTITGTSTDTKGVAAVEIAVESNGSSGPWYNASSGTYGLGPFRNAATLATPGSTSSTWSFTLPIPAGGGAYEVFANTVNTSNIVDRGATLNLSVLASNNEPTLKVSAPYVAPGGAFTSTGNAFKPGEQVAFSLFGSTVATATVGTTGNIPQTMIAVPISAQFGPTSLMATGQTSGKQSSATVNISNAWTQFGYSPSRVSDEPNDPVIAQSIDVGIGTVLGTSWVYATGAPVNTSPAVVAGVAYVGNDAGTLLAVNTSSGALAWSYTIASHAMIRSSPAINSDGSVIFGANDGNLYFLNPSGSLRQTVNLGGNIGSPALAAGNIIVASDSGKIYSIAEATGAIQWTASAGAAVHSVPMYYPNSGLVVVGDDSGAVTAYNSGTGVQRWRAMTGGPVTGGATINNNIVYVGSSSGTFYALSSATGSQLWTFVADGAITSVAAVGGAGNITFGTSKGSMYQVSPGGKQMFHQQNKYGNSPIVGVAGIAQKPNEGASENVFGVTSAGLLGLTREAGDEALAPWTFQTGAGISAPPAILNGTVYLGAGDGNLYAFSPNGKAPQSVARAGASIVKITSSWTCTTQP
jgi:outer membrane protein assembly factor BamB